MALVGFPPNAIVVVEIEQSMRVLLHPTLHHSSAQIVRLLRLPSVSYNLTLATPRFSTRLDGLGHEVFSWLARSRLACTFIARSTT